MIDISIVIPVYNSENTISDVVNGIIETLNNKYSFEIVLVNDSSRDNSLEACRNLCSKYSFVKLISFSKNFGQHNALMAGFNFATGDYVISMDDDLQNPPEEMLKLIKTIKDGNYDVVFAEYDSLKETFFRRAGSKINNYMSNELTEKPKEVYVTSYFILRSFVKDEIIKYEGPYPYIGGLIFRITKNVSTIKIKHDVREKGTSNYNIKKLLSLWINGFTGFSVKPLRMATIAGGVFSFISFIYIMYIVIRKITNGNINIGWTSLMAVSVFFGGLQLLFLGIIGEYIGRIFLCINNKPQYVIKEKKNID